MLTHIKCPLFFILRLKIKFSKLLPMKLYSKNQLIITTLIAVFFSASITSIFFILNQNKTDKNIEAAIKVSKFQNKNEELITFEQNVPETTAIPVSSENTYTQEELQNINVYESCNEAVVNINTQVTGINWFLEPVIEDGGSGSGSIIDKRGYVLTNVHVIKNATKIYVSLSNGTQYEASVVGLDEDSDLAVIKFTPPEDTELKTIPFGDSTKLKVGQKVIAIGNPYGLNRTMTTGIVSALGRPIKNSNNRIIRNMIQTDSAINPGNSGGPLLDSSGKMVGINTMIYSSSGSNAGISFAVPAETALRVTSDLLKYGKVRRGIIEASVVQLNNTIAQYAQLDISRGLLISRTTKGGNAEKAGIMQGTQAARYGSSIIYLGGDIITEIDNIAISSIADYYSSLENKRPGDEISIKLHRNGKDRIIKLILADPTPTAPRKRPERIRTYGI